MKNPIPMFFVAALVGTSLFAQDWNAIQAKLAHADVKTVVSMLASNDVFEREAALAQIARDDKRPELTRAAADALATLPSVETKVQLIAVLAERNDPAASPAIRKALRDTDDDIRKAAIIASGLMKDDKAAKALLELYPRDTTDDVREALRRIPNPDIDRYLVKKVKNAAASNRAAALDLLAARNYHGIYALAMTPQLFDGSDAPLTKSAVAAIRTYAPEGGFRPLFSFVRTLQPNAADQLLSTLTATLNESNDKVENEQFLASLLQTCSPQFAPVLTSLLGSSQGPIALATLSARLEAGDVETRKDAARNLGKWINENALPALVFAGKSDRDLGVQNLAWRMLIDVTRRDEKMVIQDRVIAALVETIWHAPRQAERSAAIETLKLYAKEKTDVIKVVLEKVAKERLELAEDVNQVKRDLNWN